MDGVIELGRRRGREGSQPGGWLQAMRPNSMDDATYNRRHVVQLVVGVGCGVANNSSCSTSTFSFRFPIKKTKSQAPVHTCWLKH